MNAIKYAISGFLMVVLLVLMVPSTFAKTFRGKVIDADTKEPIEGAVVVVYWYTARATISGESTTLKDVKECLTDREGEWSISGPKGRDEWPIPYLSLFIPYTREPRFIVFKPGYCSWPNGFGIEVCQGKIKPGGIGEMMKGVVAELPKLTKREDRWRNESVGPIYAGSDDPREEREFLKKQREFLRLLNEERRNLGLSEYRIYKELKNDK